MPSATERHGRLLKRKDQLLLLLNILGGFLPMTLLRIAMSPYHKFFTVTS